MRGFLKWIGNVGGLTTALGDSRYSDLIYYDPSHVPRIHRRAKRIRRSYLAFRSWSPSFRSDAIARRVGALPWSQIMAKGAEGS
jgi:hypothetical protein